MSMQCCQLKENPMIPDITRTKHLMHRVTLRWSWLVQQATPVEVALHVPFIYDTDRS